MPAIVWLPGYGGTICGHITNFIIITNITKGPATRNDNVDDFVMMLVLDAIFAKLKSIVDNESSTISSTISLRVAWPLGSFRVNSTNGSQVSVSNIAQKIPKITLVSTIEYYFAGVATNFERWEPAGLRT